MPGGLDSRGIYRYAEDDAGSPFSDVLNKGMDSVSNKVATLTANTGANTTALAGLGTWQAYTPTVANLTLGTGGTVTGRYTLIGKTAHFTAVVTFGTGVTTTGGVIVSLPLNAAGGQRSLNGWIRPAGSSVYPLSPWSASGFTNVTLTYLNITTGGMTNLVVNTPATWAAGGLIYVTGTYEAS